MEERNSNVKSSSGTETDVCKLPDPNPTLPGNDKPIRRLLIVLEEELEKTEAKNPTDATKKFADDLKDADKQYQGIADIVSKYEKFYDQLDCKLAEVRTWRKDLKTWTEDEVTPKTRKLIRDLRDEYEAEEKSTKDKVGKCCQWLALRGKLNNLNSLNDCLAKAVRKEEEAKDDNEAYKGLEKTVTDRFAELKSLYEKAKTLWEAEKYNSVYAVKLEFDDVYDHLGTVITWAYQQERCAPPKTESGGAYGQRSASGDAQDKEPPESVAPAVPPPSVEDFRKKLTDALRALIIRKYTRFRWQQYRLELEIDIKKFKDACDKFRKTRRDEFIQEAQDIPMQPKDQSTARNLNATGGTQTEAETV